MKTAGIILLIAGIAMIIIREVNFTTKEKVAEIGPVEINKEQDRTIGWPTYAGGVVALVGFVFLLSGSRKRA